VVVEVHHQTLQLVQVVVDTVDQLILTHRQLIQQSQQIQELMVMVMIGEVEVVVQTLVEVVAVALVEQELVHTLAVHLLQLVVQDYPQHPFLG
jgi:hypothetical protein